MSDTAKSAITTFFILIFFVTLPAQLLILAFYVHPIVAFIGYPAAVFAFRIYLSWKDEKKRGNKRDGWVKPQELERQ